MKKSLLLIGALLVLFSNDAFGWGKMGHDAIAYIADEEQALFHKM